MALLLTAAYSLQLLLHCIIGTAQLLAIFAHQLHAVSALRLLLQQAVILLLCLTVRRLGFLYTLLQGLATTCALLLLLFQIMQLVAELNKLLHAAEELRLRLLIIALRLFQLSALLVTLRLQLLHSAIGHSMPFFDSIKLCCQLLHSHFLLAHLLLQSLVALHQAFAGLFVLADTFIQNLLVTAQLFQSSFAVFDIIL